MNCFFFHGNTLLVPAAYLEGFEPTPTPLNPFAGLSSDVLIGVWWQIVLGLVLLGCVIGFAVQLLCRLKKKHRNNKSA